jgi:hypothetical protein
MNESLDATERRRTMALLEGLVSQVLMQGQRLTEKEVMDQLRLYNSIQRSSLSDSELETVARRLAERLAVDVDLGSVITSRDYQPWLEGRKRDIDWGRWVAYKALLTRQGRALKVIDKTDELTDKILDLAGDPLKTGSWARRGLVLGDVQSGKTGTYLALFNKAADAGYRLFILLAGNTEVLRQQTQARLDESFIGRDSSRSAPRRGVSATPRQHVGVGLIRRDLAQGIGMTTVLRDFRRSSYEASSITIQTNAAHPYVFVLKKNKRILEAVGAWLQEQADGYGGKLSVPVMVLDDECDYASINTKEEKDPTAINNAIRGILGLFTRSSYVAFTATPFANIFIDHGVEDDLFPRHYVYSLESPTNYVGSQETFGTAEAVKSDGLTYLKDVEAFIPLGHKSSQRVTQLPSSMTDAIDSFLLINAIRDLRGDADQPRAMLVNVSRYKAVQAQVYDLLSEKVAEIKNAIQLHYADHGTRHSIIDRLRSRLEADFDAPEITWPQVLEELPNSISDIRVRVFNSDTDKRLAEEEDAEWDRPPRMIAVGGDVLSRGLTLEGLCVSYFYRRVTASDTLMQMARWFGYRDGYRDLCRIWINAASADNYRFAADSIEELRADLRLMLRQDLTPEDFGLAVKKHPGALLITARNKMKNAEVAKRTIGLAGRRLETTTLKRHHSQNREELRLFIEAVSREYEYGATGAKWHRWREVDQSVVADYLERYAISVPESDPIFSRKELSMWVRSAKAEKFAKWDVVVANGIAGSAPPIKLTLDGKWQVPLPQRQLRIDDGLLRVSGSSRRLAGRTDLARLLDPRMRKKAEEDYASRETGKEPPEGIYYPYLERPILVIYPLGSDKSKEGPDTDDEKNYATVEAREFLVALKVAIPGDTTKVRDSGSDVEYLINTVAQEQWISEFAGAYDEDLDD